MEDGIPLSGIAMNKLLPPLIAISCLVSSCDTATPDQTFARAVLNLNTIHGFAGRAMEEQLKNPSVKLAANGKDTVTMTRKEVIDDKIAFAEDALGKVEKLKETDDSRDMLQASKAVYAFILPVLKTDYQELAGLYDSGKPQVEIDAKSGAIREKYAAGFQEKMDALVAAAKPYAERHNLKVQWDVRTSPGG